MNAQSIVFFRLISILFTSFSFTLILTKLIIKIQRRRKSGQIEREFGLKEHQIKQGTPNLGGIAIVTSTLISFLIFNPFAITNRNILGIIFTYIGFFIIGLIDDLRKIRFKSYKGLSGKARLAIELAISLWAINIIGFDSPLNWNIDLIFRDQPLYLGIVFIIFFAFIVIGSANSVNLADGLDGLASGIVMMASLPLIVYLLKNQDYVIASLLVAQVGALIGFMKYNFHPAKIFMGDGGALALGALLGICALYSNSTIILAFAATILILETLSDIIQVASYKLFKKRVFLMAPFHHALQKRGWHEVKVVMFFYLIGFIVALITTIMGVLL